MVAISGLSPLPICGFIFLSFSLQFVSGWSVGVGGWWYQGNLLLNYTKREFGRKLTRYLHRADPCSIPEQGVWAMEKTDKAFESFVFT